MRAREMAIYILLLKFHRDERMRKSMKKKIVALITAICLCAGSVIFPVDGGVTVQAAKTEVKTSGSYRYRILEDGTAVITRYDEKEDANTQITIPSELEGIKVTAIAASAFSECNKLTDIIIPDTVISIGSDAFSDCSGLANISIPDSVTYIGEWAFEGCSSLTSITIPEDVPQLLRYTFSNCTSLTTITIPLSVEFMGDHLFQNTILKDVWYGGTRDQWSYKAKRGGFPSEWEELNNATIHFIDGTTSKDPSVQLSKTSLVYNGKAQKPAVTVKDGYGSIMNSKDYTLKYANNKNVGQATVTVTFKGNYKGTIKKTFDIVPKGTSISKITAKKKGFDLKWKKQAAQTTGYEIQYSTSSKFKGAKTVKNIKAKTTSKNISRLSANKRYYVRIRTYKTVKGKKYYSDWSKSRNIKTKK